MYKIFPGFNLVETYHEWKKNHKRSESKAISRAVKLLFCFAVLITLWCLPLETFGMEGLTVVEKRVMAIFLFSTVMWILEAVPAWTTSMLAVGLLLFTASDSSLWFFRDVAAPELYGTPIKYTSILHSFADPIIMLFIGGFILAIAATKSGLDLMLARVMLKPFGTKSKYVLLGFIFVTGIFSMFLSNTATAAMMLTFLTPVLKALPADGKGKIIVHIPFLQLRKHFVGIGLEGDFPHFVRRILPFFDSVAVFQYHRNGDRFVGGHRADQIVVDIFFAEIFVEVVDEIFAHFLYPS